jgi:hypothetical protein
VVSWLGRWPDRTHNTPSRGCMRGPSAMLEKDKYGCRRRVKRRERPGQLSLAASNKKETKSNNTRRQEGRHRHKAMIIMVVISFLASVAFSPSLVVIPLLHTWRTPRHPGLWLLVPRRHRWGCIPVRVALRCRLWLPTITSIHSAGIACVWRRVPRVTRTLGLHLLALRRRDRESTRERHLLSTVW